MSHPALAPPPSARDSVSVAPNRSGTFPHTLARAAALLMALLLSRGGTNAAAEPFSMDASHAEVLTGIDVLRRDDFELLRGTRVGLITNHTGLAGDGARTVELLHQSDAVELTTLFSPEHGFEGELDISRIADSKDESTGLRIYSLYGKTRRPTPEMLQRVDTIVFDIQDIGARFYTYISTMGEAMKAADALGKRFVVLDRPNPIDGVSVSGPMLDSGQESFVGFHSLPIRHGMTIGELARMFRAELEMDLDLVVVRCEGWNRSVMWDGTGLLWTNPSPNMRSLAEALLYPGIGMLETSNLSVGRGTDTPFERVGAPWIDPLALAAELRSADVPGVAVTPIQFTPESSKYAGEPCGGLALMITDRDVFDPVRLGTELAIALAKLYPDDWEGDSAYRLLGNRRMLDAILGGSDRSAVFRAANRGVDDFLLRRSEFLIYDPQ